jgi:serine/threonine protein kinase
MGTLQASSAAPISLQGSDASDYGDFAVSIERMDVFCHAEETEGYYLDQSQNQYYPIYIGEILIDRYTIIHKLGHGIFSTVWLARDNKEKRDVALKILITGDRGEDEYSM